MHAFRQKAQKNSRGVVPKLPYWKGLRYRNPSKSHASAIRCCTVLTWLGSSTLKLPVKIYPTVSYPPTPTVTHEARRKRIAAEACRPNTRTAICNYKKITLTNDIKQLTTNNQ